MTENDMKFKMALEKRDRTALGQVPKSDLHNHAGRGGKAEDVSLHIKPRRDPFDSLNEMQVWFENSVKVHIPSGAEGFLRRVEAAFIQARRDNIKRLSLSFGLGDIVALRGLVGFSKTIDALKRKYIPEAEFLPELALLRSEISEEEVDVVKDIISFGYFKSIDICGNEKAGSLERYVDLYRFARGKHLILKAHVGEFGTARDVLEAVEKLELDEVHHGIAAASTLEAMRFLSDNKIILNVCPTSNIMLKRVENYRCHPIRKLFDHGVPVTINTDDLLIFNASVSDEYLNLYDSNVFSTEELNHIRSSGLNAYGKYQDLVL